MGNINRHISPYRKIEADRCDTFSEMRYARSLVLAECSLIVIYTIRGDVHRVVTAYLVRGKKRWLAAR